VDGPAFELPKIANRKELLAEFDKNVAESAWRFRQSSDAGNDEKLETAAGGQEIFKMPRVACIRGMVINHLTSSSRAAYGVLPLAGDSVPGLYGPSADEGQDAFRWRRSKLIAEL